MEPADKLPVAAAAADATEAAIGRTPTFFVFITGADAGDQKRVRFCTEERDWKNLFPEIVSKVADLALRSDVTDYIRLRAVCKPWRGATKDDPKLMGMDPRFFPRNWEMVRGDARREETCRFVNTPTGASIRLQIPLEYGEVIASAEGYLILDDSGQRCCTQKLRLLNPLTRAVAYLPDVFWSDVDAAGLVYDGEADADPTVVLCVRVEHFVKLIVYAKPGDSVWRIVVDGELVPYSVGGLSVRGKFYVPTPAGDVRKLELRPRPHLVYVARQEARHRWCGNHFSVTSSLEPKVNGAHDDGMLQLRYIADNVEVFSVDFVDGEGSLTLVEDQKDLNSCLLPWLTLCSESSD